MAALKDSTKKAKGNLKRLKIDGAMKELSKAWHDGMDEDLKEKTVGEIFDLLLPHGSSGKDGGNARKIPRSKLKKDRLSCIFCCRLLRFPLVVLRVPA